MDDKCRLCGNNDPHLINVFENNSSFVNLNLRICASLQIRISKTDQLSHSICQLCYTKLEDFDRFIKQCQKTQFLLSDVEEIYIPSVQEKITTIELERVPLSTDDLLSQNTDPCDDLVENNDDEVRIKRRRFPDVFLNEYAIVEENQEIEIDLDEYYENDNNNENISGDSSHNVSPVKVPFSKLASFFSSRVQVNKSDSSDENSDLKLNHGTEPIVEIISAVGTESDHEMGRVKFEKLESTDTSDMSVSLNDESKIDKLENLESVNTSDTSVSLNDEFKIIDTNDLEVKKENKASNKITNKPRKYTKAIKLKSPNLKPCPICALQFAPSEMEEHVGFHSEDQEYLDLIIAEMKEVPFKQKMHFCEECKKVFVRDSLYMEHTKDHLKIKIINCHLCDHTFAARRKLKVHLRAVHIPKNSKCNLCSYAAKTDADLQKHIKGVHEFQPIICEICGKSVSCNMSNYNRHLQTHSEDRPYKCELCSSAYKTASSLQKHKSNIHFAKSVMCTACGTICGSQIKYKKHVRRCRKRMQRYC
ncbi:zinc finger protein 525-like [Planococcus citri]|uniref:zinc finger protein 525-like n=1 Tax=Planococcus citri TaxID=170843 RepID=UPI0031F9E46A